MLNIAIGPGARGAAELVNSQAGMEGNSARQKLSLGIPDPTNSAIAMRSAELPDQATDTATEASAASDHEPRQPTVIVPAPTEASAGNRDTVPNSGEASATGDGDAVPRSNDSADAEPQIQSDSDESQDGNTAAKEASASKDDGEDAANWQQLTVKPGDSLAALFNRVGLGARDVHNVINAHERGNELARLHPGDVVAVQLDGQGQLQRLRHEVGDGETLELSRNGSSYDASIVKAELERRILHRSAVIKSSLFDAGERVGLSDDILLDLAGIFRWDIDFALDIRHGDAFTVIYEAFYRDGEKVRNGDILAAEFVNQGRSFRAVRYSNDAQTADYYDPKGRSMKKAFLRSPVDFTRVSSGFDRNRRHPIKDTRSAHLGTDYAASRGTPIKATGDGRVVYRGWKSGYGRTIVIEHANRYSTLYAHMAGYRDGLDRGDTVRQNQIIGYVGSSGQSTGPHLHYEFRVNGNHRDPQRVNLPDAKPIPDELRADFEEQTEPLLTRLAIYSRFRLAAQGQLVP